MLSEEICKKALKPLGLNDEQVELILVDLYQRAYLQIEFAEQLAKVLKEQQTTVSTIETAEKVA